MADDDQPDALTRLIRGARAWYDADFAVIPSHEDGRKRPFSAWRHFQTQRLDWRSLEALLLTGKYDGIGIIMGTASGNAEMIEVEGPIEAASARLARMRAKAAELGCEELLNRVLTGCLECSAGGGFHVFVIVTDGPALPNTKLAARDGKVIAETRGEGGFVIVAPTPGRHGHAEGSVYVLVGNAQPENAAKITSVERDLLHQLVTLALDEPTDGAPTPAADAPAAPARVSDGTAPWEEWAAATSWADILTPAGWTPTYTAADGRTHWVRPGKDPRDGSSATTLDDGPMYVFSTSTSLPALQGMSKQYVYAQLHHAGDLGAFSRELAASGWGTPLTPPLRHWDLADPAALTSLGDPETPASATQGALAGPADPYERAVAAKYAELRILDDARALLVSDQLAAAPPLDGINLTSFLAEPDQDVLYIVDQLWPIDGRVLLAAAAKAGKTTLLVANLLRVLVDGGDFLGRIAVVAFARRIALFNMEVSDSTLRRWLRDADIHDTDAVEIVNLRGKAGALLLSTIEGRRRLAQWLRDHDIGLVLLDPLAPLLAAHGLDENSNTDVAKFFAWWAEALALGGVRADLIVHHTGHAGERSRGASRLLDEPDAVWTLTKEKPPTDDDEDDFAGITAVRHLAAYGRDVELPAEALDFDPRTRRLTLTGRSPQQARRDHGSRRAEEAILDYLATHDGATTRDLKKAPGAGRDYLNVITKLVAERRIDTSVGPRRTVHHHLPVTPPDPPTP